MSWKGTDEWRERATLSNTVDQPKEVRAMGFSNMELTGDVSRSSFGGVTGMKAQMEYV